MDNASKVKAAISLCRTVGAVWLEGMQMLVRAAFGKNQ